MTLQSYCFGGRSNTQRVSGTGRAFVSSPAPAAILSSLRPVPQSEASTGAVGPGNSFNPSWLSQPLRSEGHEVVGPAATVEDAQHFAGEGADFALVDINLAGHDEGVELARDLKSRFGIASAFVSGQSGAAHSNKDAAVGLLRKPYTAKSLIEATAVIAEIVSGGSPPPPSVPPAFELFA